MNQPPTDVQKWLASPRGRPTSEFLEMTAVLEKDELRSRADLARNEDFAKRQYIRTLFAKLEGFVYGLKRMTLGDGAGFSTAEQALLTDTGYSLDQKGLAVEQTAFLRFEPNLRFAFQMYAKSCGVKYELPVSERGWQCLRSALRVRHRLTHPKQLADLSVSDEELDSAIEASNWIKAEFAELQHLAINKILYDDGFSAEQIREFHEMMRRMLEDGATNVSQDPASS